MNITGHSRIFISYSHAGNGPKWKTALVNALHVFESQHLLDVWQDGRIRVSSFWDDDITQAMDSAQLAVVLLTPEALASDYIVHREFPVLSQRQKNGHLPVIPVVCEPCKWKPHEWIRATQSPNSSNPLSELSPTQVDAVFRTLAADIAEKLGQTALTAVADSSTSFGTTKVYLDRFPITRTSGLREDRLIGREQELALLDLAFAQPQTAIASLIAWGGVGKTMLVQHWLRRLERDGWFGAQRVYGWSFYSQGTKEDRQASEDMFLAHALQWFGVECEPTLSAYEKGGLLADAVARERTLIILDGIEPLQYPPGPMGGQLRAPGVESLLRHLARKSSRSVHNGLCLVTTREPLTDLADFQRRKGSPRGSALRVDLGNLTEEAGAALLHHAGANRAGGAEIKSDDKALLSASRDVDGHALTLNLLGRFLARAHVGDIRRRDLVKFEEADRLVQGGTTFRMLKAFERWFARGGTVGARQLAVLRILGLFDRPADAGCVAALRSPPPIAGLTDSLFTPGAAGATWQPLAGEDFNTATSFLADFGLLSIQPAEDGHSPVLDCHPLVREHFAAQLHQSGLREAWRFGNDRLFEHLTSNTLDRANPSLQDLQPLYQAVKHGCEAGRYEEARLDVLWKRILRGEEHYSWRQLGAFSDDLAALASLFREPWSVPASALTLYSRSLVMGQAAICLLALGRLQEALPPMQEAAGLMFDQENWQQASIGTGNLCELQRALGGLEEASRIAEMAITFANQSGDRRLLVTWLSAAAQCYLEQKKWDEAEVYFDCAERLMAPLPLIGMPGFYRCQLLMVDIEEAAWQAFLGLDPVGFMNDPQTAASTGGPRPLSAEQRLSLLRVREEVVDRVMHSQRLLHGKVGPLDDALDHLTLAYCALYCAVLDQTGAVAPSHAPGSALPERAYQIVLHRGHLQAVQRFLPKAMDGLRRARQSHHLPPGLLAVGWLRTLEGDAAGAAAALDDAWDIAERGAMRLHMADIHLYRARLFFSEERYPWASPQDDLGAAEKLINDCGYHRRDEELADAIQAILGK